MDTAAVVRGLLGVAATAGSEAVVFPVREGAAVVLVVDGAGVVRGVAVLHGAVFEGAVLEAATVFGAAAVFEAVGFEGAAVREAAGRGVLVAAAGVRDATGLGSASSARLGSLCRSASLHQLVAVVLSATCDALPPLPCQSPQARATEGMPTALTTTAAMAARR
ncbi:hypothetical protein ACF061_13280 [Streptomyces sp. NPDC015220]|uniref:hypothetical protein n=1 Tax=Streptomyces sp. NPDC015220 TaxID=3364947 RepID=UPI0037026250